MTPPFDQMVRPSAADRIGVRTEERFGLPVPNSG